VSPTGSQSKERNGDEANILLALQASMTYYDENSFPVAGDTALDLPSAVHDTWDARLKKAAAMWRRISSDQMVKIVALEEETLP